MIVIVITPRCVPALIAANAPVVPLRVAYVVGPTVPTVAVTETFCPQTLPPKNKNIAMTPTERRRNFFNKFSVGLVARDSLNFTFDTVCTRDTREYNDFMPVAI